eukprot:231004_1
MSMGCIHTTPNSDMELQQTDEQEISNSNLIVQLIPSSTCPETLINALALADFGDEPTLYLEVKYCAIQHINGIYTNQFFSNMNNRKIFCEKMRDAMDAQLIDSSHIFIHNNQSNTFTEKCVLFLHQNTSDILKNIWYIARYMDSTDELKILFYAFDRVSCTHYVPPLSQWRPYDHNVMNDTITMFNAENTINILEVDENHFKEEDIEYRILQYSLYLKSYDGIGIGLNGIQHKIAHFDDICDISLPYKSIKDTIWYSDAHSWYKHLRGWGNDYIANMWTFFLYPDYDGMIRNGLTGYRTKFNDEIRWHFTRKQDYISKIFNNSICQIVTEYGKVGFNSHFSGLHRFGERGNVRSWNMKYMECSDILVENAVRHAFKLQTEIMRYYKQLKLFMLQYWMKYNNVTCVIYENISDIIVNYIFIEYESFAFKPLKITDWMGHKVKRYFIRLLIKKSKSKIGIKCVDKLINQCEISGR